MRIAKPGWAAVSPREGRLRFLSISTLGALPWMVSFSYISIFLIKFWSHCLISLPSLFCAENDLSSGVHHGCLLGQLCLEWV